MRPTPVHSWLLPCLIGGMALATPAFAQDEDVPFAYPDEETPARKTPGRSRSPVDTTDDFRRVSEEKDKKSDFKRLAGLDDPNTGVAFEVLGGVMGLSSSRGRLMDLLPAVGGHFTWEYGRLLNVESLREALWFDLRYLYAGQREGTQLIVGDTRLHYVSIAPAYELTFGSAVDYGVYVQAGGGVAYHSTALEVGGERTAVNGIKPLIQYGAGLRGRTKLSSQSNLRLAWRLEVTRYRRGYLDDTFFGASLGTAF
jgi:hypothetical protein